MTKVLSVFQTLFLALLQSFKFNSSESHLRYFLDIIQDLDDANYNDYDAGGTIIGKIVSDCRASNFFIHI